MSSETVGLIIGGVLPAILIGIFPIAQKIATNNHIGIGPYFIAAGLGVLLIGVVCCCCFKDNSFSVKSSCFAALSGIIWACATTGVLIALIHYQTPISKLVPLINSNTIIAVTLSLIVFSEWETVSPKQILIASLFIITGAILAARANV